MTTLDKNGLRAKIRGARFSRHEEEALLDWLEQGFGGRMTTEAGAGITSGTGTVYVSAVERIGKLRRTSILLDLTGLRSTAAGDIIGVNGTSLACHLGQYLTEESGTLMFGNITCIETPAGGDPDVDFYAADEATGTEDTAISALTNDTQLVNNGDWTGAPETKVPLTDLPAANQYLYAVAGATTDADYSAGQFLIELVGYAA